jgi:hypothetical protein
VGQQKEERIGGSGESEEEQEEAAVESAGGRPALATISTAERKLEPKDIRHGELIVVK